MLISYQFWQSHFDGNPDAIGRKLRLKDYAFQIVGILPRSFHDINDVGGTPDIRLPISAAAILTGHSVFRPYDTPLTDPMLFEVYVRLAPHVAATSVEPAITRVARTSETATLNFIYSERHWPVVSSAMQYFVGYNVGLKAIPSGISSLREEFSRALYALMGAVGLLLLAACANVAGLLLARGERRRQEIAIRIAVGASRSQLLRQFFMENLFLAISAAGLGILFAYFASPMLLRLIPPVRLMGMYPSHETVAAPLDRLVLGFTIAAALLSIFLFGLGPAWRQTGAVFAGHGSDSRQSRRKTFSGALLVTVQVGLSIVLVAGAVLMVRTFWALEHVNPGFDYTHAVAFELSPKLAGYSGKQATAFLQQVKTEVAAIPGVRSDAYALQGLMERVARKEVVVHRGEVLPKALFDTWYNAVSPGYFRTMGIPLLFGRATETGDGSKKITPVVVNKAFADHFFPHQNPLGKEMITGINGKNPPDIVMVGVVGTANYQSMSQTEPRILYWPLDSAFGQREQETGIVFCVRSFGEPETIINEVRSAIHRIDTKAPIVAVSTLKQQALSTLWETRLMMLLAGIFGIVSLVLAAAGIYGSLAYSVASRTREIGIRLAIGAQRKDILRTVCGQMSIAVGCGLLVGIFAAAFLLRLAQSLFFGVQVLDPYSFSIAILCLLLSGIENRDINLC